MFVIIVGSGRLAIGLACSMASRRDDVVIIDRGIDARKLGDSFDGVSVDGDPMDIETLEKVGARRCDLFIAVTGDDNVNAASAQAAKLLFNVPKVLARIADPPRESFFRELGLSTVCPTTTGINEVLDWLTSDRLQPWDVYMEPSIVCVQPKKEWIGKNFGAIDKSQGVKIVGVVRKGILTRIPSRDFVREGDTVIVSIRHKRGQRLLWNA
jgi:K+ transport systems, NAD-binding component